MTKRILIDGRFIGVGESISRYVLEMTKGILALDKINHYTLLIRPEGEGEIERYPEIVNAPNLNLDIIDIPHYSLAEQTKLLKYLKNEKFDLVHFTQFNHPIGYKGKYVVTIHDLTLLGHLPYHSLVKKIAYDRVMKSAAKDAEKIIAVSNTTMKDVAAYAGVSEAKFEVIYLGIDHEHYNAQVGSRQSAVGSFKEKYKIAGDYILYTGMWKKHKNLVRLFKAFEQYLTNCHPEQSSSVGGQSEGSSVSVALDSSVPQNDKKSLQLVLTGKIDKNEPEVIAEIDRINNKVMKEYKNKAIITTGFIDEGDLPIAYAGALMYAIPSLSEGFGWPPLEAMACGTPVIASKESCIPEILDEAPLYFNPYDVEDIASAISKVANDENLRHSLIEKGLNQVKNYDWQECAKKTFDLYKSLL